MKLTSLFVLLGLATFPLFGSAEYDDAPERIFAEDGAWCWFQDPRAVYVNGIRERTYAQWVTHDGMLQVGAFDHQTGQVETYTLKGHWHADDHNVGSFIVLPDKRLMVFYAQHNRVGLYGRTSLHPEDIRAWGAEIPISESDRITYSHPCYLEEEGRFFVFWRGPSWKPTFATSLDGQNWTEPQILLQEEGREDRSIRPYTKIVSDGKSTIHLAFTDGHPRNEPENSVYYLRYQEGHFYRADGSLVASAMDLPISHASSDVVYNGRSTGVRAWVWDIALTPDGAPVIAYTRLPSEDDHRYCYARWTGKEWFDTEITGGGKWFPQTPEGVKEREPHYSGGIVINHNDPSVVYLSKEAGEFFELQRWETRDLGETWQSRAISQESRQLNVRPVVPVGYAGERDLVLWMYGEYEHFTRYNTGIRLHDVNPNGYPISLDIRDVPLLNEVERAHLRERMRTDPDFWQAMRPAMLEADAILPKAPRPVQEIVYEGLVSNDPRRVHCVINHLRDMDDVAALIHAWYLSGQDVYARKIREYLLAWATTFVPTGNAINENKLAPLMHAWSLHRESHYGSAERDLVDAWFTGIMEKELEAARDPHKRQGNWHTKRLRMAAFLGRAMRRPEWTQYARDGVKEFVENSLYPDGTSYDFERRDTLLYHMSALKPIFDVVRTLGEPDLYYWESPVGSSIKKSVDFVVPFATGERTRREWVNSEVDLDRRRAESGLDKYEIGKLFDPQDAIEFLDMAESFDPSLAERLNEGD